MKPKPAKPVRSEDIGKTILAMKIGDEIRLANQKDRQAATVFARMIRPTAGWKAKTWKNEDGTFTLRAVAP